MTIRGCAGWMPLLLGAGALVLGGCLGRTPTVRNYTLAALPEQRAVGSRPATGPAIEVGPLSLPRALERPQIVRRTSDHELAYQEFHRWATGLESEMLRVLGDDLATLLATSRVVVYPAVAPFPIDWRVRIDVQQFDGCVGDEVTLRARWVVVPGGGGSAVAVDADDFEAFVDAHSRAVATLARAMADRLGALAPKAQ